MAGDWKRPDWNRNIAIGAKVRVPFVRFDAAASPRPLAREEMTVHREGVITAVSGRSAIVKLDGGRVMELDSVNSYEVWVGAKERAAIA